MDAHFQNVTVTILPSLLPLKAGNRLDVYNSNKTNIQYLTRPIIIDTPWTLIFEMGQ